MDEKISRPGDTWGLSSSPATGQQGLPWGLACGKANSTHVWCKNAGLDAQPKAELGWVESKVGPRQGVCAGLRVFCTDPALPLGQEPPEKLGRTPGAEGEMCA